MGWGYREWEWHVDFPSLTTHHRFLFLSWMNDFVCRVGYRCDNTGLCYIVLYDGIYRESYIKFAGHVTNPHLPHNGEYKKFARFTQ